MMGHVQELEIGRRAIGHTEQVDGFTAASSNTDPLAEGMMVEAAVKWFNVTKGYGFVELSDGHGDAFLHLKTLREIGRQTLPSGAKIRVVTRTGPRGAEVVRVVEVDNRGSTDRSPRRSAFDPAAAVDLTGKVKWFDDARGFGFIAGDDFGRDIFVHSTTLGASGVMSLFEGQEVSMRVVETPKGREAIAIVV